MVRGSEDGDSLDQIGSEIYQGDTDLMANEDDGNDSLGEASIRHDLELNPDNGLHSLRQDRDSSDGRSGLENDKSVSDRKRKRSHSGAISEKTQLGENADFSPGEDDDSTHKQRSRVPESHGRHKRSKIDTFAFHGKRISDELDSDDELILQMRENGFSDRQIAERLEKEGRVRYDEKSISTRIVRIRHAKAEKFDFLLKEGYKEWKHEDDKLLLQAYSLVDIEINYEIERVRAWRFRKVSDYMRRLNKESLFSATACRERYNALVEGTARIPIELDDDPEARRTEMEAYRISREKTRRKEQAEEALKKATEAKLKAEQKSRKAQKAEESANRRAQRAAEKVQRATQRAEKAKIRAARAKEKEELKARRKAQIKEKAAGKAANKTPCSVPAPAHTPAPVPGTTLTAPADTPATNTVEKTNSNPTDTTNTSSAPKPKTRIKNKTNNITADTPDPRTNLSLADLKKLCKDSGIRSLSYLRTKTALLQALRNADDEYCLKDLKNMCLVRGLNVTGSKTLLKYRLALAAARSCASFGKSAGASTGEEGNKGDVEMEEEEEDLVV